MGMPPALAGGAVGTDVEKVLSAGQVLNAAAIFALWTVEHAVKMILATISLVAKAALAAVMVVLLQEASAASW